MPFTQTSALGRRVRLDDWRSLHRDRLLVVLYQMRESGGDENGLTTQQIADVTGLDLSSAAELIRSMTSRPTLIDASRDVWMITERGVRWAEESPRPPAE